MLTYAESMRHHSHESIPGQIPVGERKGPRRFWYALLALVIENLLSEICWAMLSPGRSSELCLSLKLCRKFWIIIVVGHQKGCKCRYS